MNFLELMSCFICCEYRNNQGRIHYLANSQNFEALKDVSFNAVITMMCL